MASDESYTPDLHLTFEVPSLEADESWAGERRRSRPRKRRGRGTREGAGLGPGDTEQRGENLEGGDGPGGRGERAGPAPDDRGQSGGRGQRGGRGRRGGRGQRGGRQQSAGPGGGGNSGPRAGGGGRGRRRRGGRDAEEEGRVQVLPNDRRVQTEELIQNMSEMGLRTLATRIFSRNPGLVFDALPPLDSTTLPPAAALPWCTCGNCREMATDAERKCCGQGPEHCISKLPHFELYCLEDGYLRIHSDYRNDVLVVAEVTEPGDDNRQFRYAAYRQYTFWQHGSLGQGNRGVIPSCCIWRIRDKYPDPQGQYTGFIPTM